MPPLPTVQLGGFPGRLFMPLRSGSLTEDLLAKMTYKDYEDGNIRVYCDADVAPPAAAGHQAGSVVAAVSCNQHAPPSPSFDFSTVAGCQNWWMRFSPVLSVAAVADLPLTLGPYVSVTKLQRLSTDQNHVLGMVSWSAKMKITQRSGPTQRGDGAQQHTEMRLQVKDDSGGRAFLLLQDEWATQCTGLQKDDTLIISGAFLRALECDDPGSLHPSHIGFDLVMDKATAPEARMVVIFPLGTSNPPTVVLTRATFARGDMFPPVQRNGQRQPALQQRQGFITAAQHAASTRDAGAAASASGDDAAAAAAAAAPAAAVAAAGGNKRGSKRQKVDQTYTYVDLGSLPMHGQQNIYGVISEFRMPRKTKGTDYMMNLTLIDPSSADDSPPGVQINIMLKPDRLQTCPSQLRIGRIIRLHRLRMQNFNGRAQGFVSGSSGVSFALAEAEGDSSEPVEFGVINAASAGTNNPQAAGTALKTPLDMSRVAALRAWNSTEFLPQIAAIKQEYSAPISDIQTGRPFDLTCLVIGVVRSSTDAATGGNGRAQELYVWDGTRAKFPTKRYSAVQAPGAGRYAACGTVIIVDCAKASLALQLAVSHASSGDIVQLKDCRLSDGTAATAWGPPAGRAVCFKFRDTGRCDFGDRCQYAHDRNSGNGNGNGGGGYDGNNGGGFDGPMSSMFTGAPGSGFDGNGGGGAGATSSSGGGGGGAAAASAAAAAGPRKQVWHIEFGDFSNFMVLPAQMRPVQEMTEQWEAHLAARAPPAAAPVVTPSIPAAASTAAAGAVNDAGAAASGAGAAAQSAGAAQQTSHVNSHGGTGNAAAADRGDALNTSMADQGAMSAAGSSGAQDRGGARGQAAALVPTAGVSSGGGRLPLARPPYYLMVETPHTPHVQATSLRGILDHPTVPAIFRCVVRIADLLPRTDHGFIAPFCDFCQRCSVSPQCVIPPPPAAPAPPSGRFAGAASARFAPPPLVEPQAAAAAASTPHMICERCHGEMADWTYWCMLKLVDESATIGALLYRDCGEDFFDGVKAAELRHDRSRLTKLRTHFQTLLQPPPGRAGAGGAGAVYLANLCLKSYYAPLPEGKTSLPKGQKQKVCYQIFDSSITVNPHNGQPEAKLLDDAVAVGAAIPQR